MWSTTLTKTMLCLEETNKKGWKQEEIGQILCLMCKFQMIISWSYATWKILEVTQIWLIYNHVRESGQCPGLNHKRGCPGYTRINKIWIKEVTPLHTMDKGSSIHHSLFPLIVESHKAQFNHTDQDTDQFQTRRTTSRNTLVVDCNEADTNNQHHQ